MELLNEIATALENGDAETTGKLTADAIENGLSPKEILDNGLIAGMQVVGRKFKAHEIFLPDVLMSAKAMYAGMDLLKPLLIRDGVPTIGKVVLGSVKGDLHDIGKNLVAIMLKGAGFDIIDLGSDVPAEKFVDSAVENNARIIGMSALLTTTMPQMGEVTRILKERGLEDEIKVVIGGAPINDSFVEEIGADAYAFDGISAVEKVKELLRIE